MKFVLEIEMENAAMRSGHDLARVLRRVADIVQPMTRVSLARADTKVLDENGNTVGKFEVKGAL